MPKFFVEPDQIQDGKVFIKGNDAAHISFSLRMAKGDRVQICDGSGKEYSCVLTEFLSEVVEAEIVDTFENQNEAPIQIYLYQALPKGDKLETVIQKSVECGVFEIIPFESERCVVKVKAEAEEKKTQRRNRISEEAAKQCGRGYVPLVSPTVSFENALVRAAKADLALVCYEDEKGTTIKQVLQKENADKISTISVMIGSEGGFSAKEIERAVSCGLVPVSLGKRILRTETAPIFVLSNLSYQFEL